MASAARAAVPWCLWDLRGKGDVQTRSCIQLQVFNCLHRPRPVPPPPLRYPFYPQFGLFLKQLLYFDRYTRILAPSLQVFNDERINTRSLTVQYG